jgi:hypothetical protein
MLAVRIRLNSLGVSERHAGCSERHQLARRPLVRLASSCNHHLKCVEDPSSRNHAKRMVAKLSLDKQLLQDVAGETCKSRAAAVRSAESAQTLSDSRAPRGPLLGQRRGTQRHTPILRGDQDALTWARFLIEASIREWSVPRSRLNEDRY